MGDSLNDQELVGVRRLIQSDVIHALFNFDAEIISDKPKITHLKLLPHFDLKGDDVLLAGGHDNQIIYIYTDNQMLTISVTCVDVVFSTAPRETK
jgi:hypothetical protein